MCWKEDRPFGASSSLTSISLCGSEAVPRISNLAVHRQPLTICARLSSDDACRIKQVLVLNQVWADFSDWRAWADCREGARAAPTRKYLKMFPSSLEGNSCRQILQCSATWCEWAGAGMRTN